MLRRLVDWLFGPPRPVEVKVTIEVLEVRVNVPEIKIQGCSSDKVSISRPKSEHTPERHPDRVTPPASDETLLGNLSEKLRSSSAATHFGEDA